MGLMCVKINKKAIGKAIEILLKPFTIYHEFEPMPNDLKLVEVNDFANYFEVIFSSKTIPKRTVWELEAEKDFQEFPRVSLKMIQIKSKWT